MFPRRLIIVGAGMAAAYLLKELAEFDHGMAITVIGEEPDVCYNRVMLSEMLAGEADGDDLTLLDGAGDLRAVRFLSGTRVESVSLQGQRLLTDNGESLNFDYLVFATGATVARPDVVRCQLEGVTGLRTLDDVRRLRSPREVHGSAVVLGGGLLGLEAAHGLNALGFETTVVHRQHHLMNRQLDEEGGRLLCQMMTRSGLNFRLGASLHSMQSTSGKITAITLQDGSSMPCDLLVLATGIDPNAELARRAGIATERGVLVDEYMRTSDPNCFALGECSQLGDRCFGLVAPIKEQAKALAKNLAGISDAAFALEDWPTQLKISGVEIFSAGTLRASGDQILMRDKGAGIYRRLILRDDRLVGAVLVGDKRGGVWYSRLIRDRTDVSQYRGALMFGEAISESLLAAAVAA